MARLQTTALLISSCVLGLALAVPAAANDRRVRAKLTGLDEHPLALSTLASGNFRAEIDRRRGMIEYDLSYEEFPSDVTQAHIHFGHHFQAGGISVFLCTNLGNGPAGTPACPLRSGKVSGTVGAAGVVGPAGQGIAAGELAELLEAIDEGVTYVNVHTTAFPGGEIRGQIK